jgi:hypothetical protein
MVAAIIAFGWGIRSWGEPLNIAMVLLLPVILSSILWETRVGLFTALVAVGCLISF